MENDAIVDKETNQHTNMKKVNTRQIIGRVFVIKS